MFSVFVKTRIKANFQNPREASSWLRIFLISLVNLCMYLCIYLFISRLLAKRKTIQTSNLAHILQLTLSENGFFVFLDQIPVTAASLEKLPCHADFPHISSIALLFFYLKEEGVKKIFGRFSAIIGQYNQSKRRKTNFIS